MMNERDVVMKYVGWARPCAHAGMSGQSWMWAGNFVQAARAFSTVTRGHDNAVPTLQFGGVGV